VLLDVIQRGLDHTEDTEESTGDTEVGEGGVICSGVSLFSIIVLTAVCRGAVLCHNEIKSA